MVVSTAFAAFYADWRAKKAPRPPLGGTTMSITQVLELHHHHGPRRSSTATRASSRKRKSWLEQEPVGAGLIILCSVAVGAYLIARGFAAARDELMFTLLTLASINFGTALGAFGALRKHEWFDRSWRWPVAACAVVGVIGGLDAYLLLHPSFATGNYEEVFRSFLRERPVFEGAFADVDANAFVAFQGIAALLALMLLVLSLILVVGVWAAVEESVGLRPAWPRRAVRGLVPRRADRTGASVALILLAVLSATACAGLYYNLFKRIPGLFGDDGPTVASVGARPGTKKISVRLTVHEPVRLRVTVRRADGHSAGRATFELRPGSRRVSLYARPDRKRMRRGRYTVSIVVRNEAGDVTRRTRFVRVR